MLFLQTNRKQKSFRNRNIAHWQVSLAENIIMHSTMKIDNIRQKMRKIFLSDNHLEKFCHFQFVRRTKKRCHHVGPAINNTERVTIRLCRWSAKNGRHFGRNELSEKSNGSTKNSIETLVYLLLEQCVVGSWSWSYTPLEGRWSCLPACINKTGRYWSWKWFFVCSIGQR